MCWCALGLLEIRDLGTSPQSGERRLIPLAWRLRSCLCSTLSMAAMGMGCSPVLYMISVACSLSSLSRGMVVATHVGSHYAVPSCSATP